MHKTTRLVIIGIVCTLIFPSCGKVIRVLFSYINNIVQSPEFAQTVDAVAKMISGACINIYHEFIASLNTIFSASA